MNNISSCDSIVEEYLIYRGFTKTFKHLQKEKLLDRLNNFHTTKIVEQIFNYIYSYDMESFINLWDFLNQRFFLHLDQQHMYLLNNLKYDLIKYYLINCIKKNMKEKLFDFFVKYSHEIISDSGENIAPIGGSVGGGGGNGNILLNGGNGSGVTGLRSWYVLPYMSEPEKDAEFSVYFTTRWSDMLRVTLNNFLSTILLNAPPPKLLLLEKWFRSEAQQEIRVQLSQASDNVDHLLTKLKSYEERLINMREIVKELALHIHHHQNPSSTSDDTTMIQRQEEGRELGQLVCRLATECVQQKVDSSSSFQNQSSPRNKGGPSALSSEELEFQLTVNIQTWLRTLTADRKQTKMKSDEI